LIIVCPFVLFLSLLAATLYQGNRDRNHKLWNIGSFDLRVITYNDGVSGMLLHANGKYNGKIEIISFVVKFRS